MAGTNYDIVDIQYSAHGDLAIATVEQSQLGGDISTTAHDRIKGIQQLITTYIRSTKGAFRDMIDVGTDLDSFIGEPNTRELGEKIQQAITNTLVNAGVVRAGDLRVSVTPIDIHSILVSLHLNAAATPQNSLKQDGLVLAYMFDTIEADMWPIIEYNNENIGNA